MSDFAPDVDTTNSNDYPKEKRVEFQKLTDGNQYTLRILETEAKKVFTHYLNRFTVKCLGDDCPICAKTIKLSVEYPESYRKEPGYAPRSKRYYVNVLDKTPVKTCPECETEYVNTTLSICSKCDKPLDGPAPSNKVKMLAKGPAVFGQLNDIHKAVTTDDGLPIGINNYDLTFVVKGVGKETKITVIPNPGRNQPSPENLELWDYEKALIELEPDEMLELQAGVSLSDIFKARRDDSDVDLGSNDPLSSEFQKEIDDAVGKLFST